jgi:hypothetical protein
MGVNKLPTKNLNKSMKYYLILILNVLVLLTNAQPAKNNASSVFDFYNYPPSYNKTRYKIAVLTPMFLDSFDLAKSLTKIPSYAMPGLDFYQGIKIANDTLNNLGYKADVYVFDSKSRFMNIENLIASDKLDSVDVIIGNIGGADLKTMANFASTKKINFISAVSPADADQSNNPYFTLLQPRLITHIERIHKQIANKYNAKQPILFIHRNLPNENNAYSYYKNDPITKGAMSKEVLLNDDLIEANALENLIKKDVENVIILGLLDPKTAYDNLKVIQDLVNKGYKFSIYGMPTWDNIKALKSTDEFKDMDIYFTSAMLIDKQTKPYQFIQKSYKEKMGTPITEIVYKGFEALYFCTTLLDKYGTPFNTHLSDNSGSFVTPYRILPVIDNKNFKYFENKYLYLTHYYNGVLTYE